MPKQMGDEDKFRDSIFRDVVFKVVQQPNAVKYCSIFFLYILLTVHLNIFILILTNLMH